MLLPNRLAGLSPSYDEEGRLVGGLDALGDLAEAMMAEADPEIEEEEEEEIEHVEEQAFPVSQNRKRRSFASDSDSDGGSMFNEEVKADVSSELESGSSNEATTRAAGISPVTSIENLVDRLSLIMPGSPGGKRQPLPVFSTSTPPVTGISKPGSVLALTAEPDSITDDDDDDSDLEDQLSPGDRLKTRFMELGILSTLVVCLFKEFRAVFKYCARILFSNSHGTISFIVWSMISYTKCSSGR
jgi:hypothetical protein